MQKVGLAPTFVLNNKTNKKINLKKYLTKQLILLKTHFLLPALAYKFAYRCKL